MLTSSAWMLLCVMLQSMPMRATREDPFIQLFLSAYEKGSWADAHCKKADAIDRTNPAVGQIASWVGYRGHTDQGRR
jgi:hypothetical protein